MSLKNFVALVLAFAMVFSLTACVQFGNDSEVSSTAVSSKPEKVYISVADYISNGEIYGCQFKLKTPINDIKTAYHYGDEDPCLNVDERFLFFVGLVLVLHNNPPFVY